MGFTIGRGITIGRGVNFRKEIPPPPVFEYLFGNSRCYSGSGPDYGNADWVDGPGNYDKNYIFDLQANLQNATVGRPGYFNVSGGDARPYWVNQGTSSYFDFNSSDYTYIDCNPNSVPCLPANSSYTIHAIVKVNAFDDGSNPTGAIIAGDQSSFGFLPTNALGTNYPILCASPTSGGPETYAIDAGTIFQVDTWYNVGCVYNAQTQTMKLFVNGELTVTQTDILPFNNNEPLYIGTWEGYNWLNGSIGGLTLWSRALDDSEFLSYSSSVSEPYNGKPAAISSQVYTTPGIYNYFVPQNQTSISVVGVGAGGGGTDTSFAFAGGDTVVYDQTNLTPGQETAGGVTTFITVDSAVYPDILNVDTNYIVRGTPIDVVSTTFPGFAKVTYVNSSNPNAVQIYINKTIGINIGDFFEFAPGIVYAEGAYEINNDTYNNGDGGPGPRAQALIGDGGGRGGVVDYLTSWPIGGAGAGGYKFETIKTASELATPKVCFDTNQSYLYNLTNEDIGLGTPGLTVSLTNNNLTAVGLTGGTNFGYNAIGTYPIKITDKVMFSLTLDTINATDTMGIGLCNSDANVQYWPGGNNNSSAFFDSGTQYWQDASQVNGLPTFTAGDVVDLAVDQIAGAVWYRVNGGYWNGDPAADPTNSLTGKSVFFTGTMQDPNIYLMVCAGYNTDVGQWSINTTSTYSVPSGFTFVGGAANAGASGGDGSSTDVATMKPGQSGAGGGGSGIYGISASGGVGVWANDNDLNSNFLTPIGDGGEGGSSIAFTGTDGGEATSWAGGRGGFPGGGGGSGVGYYVGANGGALAFKNNYAVVPGQQLTVVVGQPGNGEDSGGGGAPGAVRILLDGSNRQFPSTNVTADDGNVVFDPSYTVFNDPENPMNTAIAITNLGHTVIAIGPVNMMGSSVITSSLVQYPITWGQKIMFSVTVNSLANEGLNCNGIGVAPHSVNLFSQLGDNNGTNGVGFYETGAFLGDTNGYGGLASSFTAGDTVDIAVDYFHGLIYSRVNNGYWNNDPYADPGTGTNGFLIKTYGGNPVDPGPLYPAVTPFYDTGTSTGNQFTLLLTPTTMIPSGFSYLGL